MLAKLTAAKLCNALASSYHICLGLDCHIRLVLVPEFDSEAHIGLDRIGRRPGFRHNVDRTSHELLPWPDDGHAHDRKRPCLGLNQSRLIIRTFTFANL